MITFLTIIHVIVSVFLILVVLLQQGKGQDIGSAFGGGGTQATFGARSGVSLLSKLTTVSAAVFMVTSLSLTILISQPGRTSVIDEEALTVPTEPIDGTLPVNELLDLETTLGIGELPLGADIDLGAALEEETDN